MSEELKKTFENKCIGLTDDHRDYIYGTDWKGYAKALEKELKELKEATSIGSGLAKYIISLEKQVKELEDSISKMYMLCVSQKYDEVENILNNLEHGD